MVCLHFVNCQLVCQLLQYTAIRGGGICYIVGLVDHMVFAKAIKVVRPSVTSLLCVATQCFFGGCFALTYQMFTFMGSSHGVLLSLVELELS